MGEWSGVGDQIDRTARRVRDGKAVHDLEVRRTQPLRYLTKCGQRLLAEDGAVLTTVHANCWACVPGGVRRG